MTSQTEQAPPRRRFKLLRRPPESIRPAVPRPQRKDCQGQLVAAIEALIGERASIAEASLRPWCSATFIGAQHRIMLRLEGEHAAPDAQAISAMLRDAEYRLRGHIVADVAVDEIATEADGTVRINLTCLTIEDW